MTAVVCLVSQSVHELGGHLWNLNTSVASSSVSLSGNEGDSFFFFLFLFSSFFLLSQIYIERD